MDSHHAGLGTGSAQRHHTTATLTCMLLQVALQRGTESQVECVDMSCIVSSSTDAAPNVVCCKPLLPCPVFACRKLWGTCVVFLSAFKADSSLTRWLTAFMKRACSSEVHTSRGFLAPRLSPILSELSSPLISLQSHMHENGDLTASHCITPDNFLGLQMHSKIRAN